VTDRYKIHEDHDWMIFEGDDLVAECGDNKYAALILKALNAYEEREVSYQAHLSKLGIEL